MKIAVAQINYHIGHFDHNCKKILEAVEQAKFEGADLIIFSELCVCGYPPRDFLEFSDFIKRSDDVLEEIKKASQDIGIFVGAPTVNPIPEGKDLYNSGYFIADGEIVATVHKTLLPTYDVFDEYRYFEPNNEFKVIEYKGKKIALTICEDIWNIGNENPLYTVCPMDHLIKQQPDFMVNLSASPFDYDHPKERIHILKSNCERYHIPAFYVNHIGAQTELIFDGGSLVMTADARVYDQLPHFKEAFRCYDLDHISAGVEEDQTLPHSKMELIHDALILGIKDYFGKLGFKQAILGLSGGIDSALTLYLAVKALGKENVCSVLMPSRYSSDHSISDSLSLLKNLGSPSETLEIEKPYTQFLEILQPVFKDAPFNVTEENIQARIRATILMAMSNKHGYILLNTSNKSEAAVGYGTLYGDMCGGLSVIGDVYKTEVVELCHYINRNGVVIPENIITKPPSAELRPDQKDSDSLPEYDILDPILFHYIEEKLGPKEIIALGFEKALVDRILRMVNVNEYKRFQTPPVLRVSPKAFGMGRRLPIVGRYLS